MNTAAFVRHMREVHGLTQLGLAKFLDMKPNGERTVRGWEAGEHVPSSEFLRKLYELPKSIPFLDERTVEESKFTFIDLFAGIGGIRLPFQELGGKCVFTSEWDRFSQKTYTANFGDIPNGDITKIKNAEIPEHDVLLGGFPCQAFSQAGLRGGFMDTRGTMFFEIQRILAERRPKAFLLENVKQLKGHDSGRTLETILSILRGDGVTKVPLDVPMSEDARESLNTRLNYQTEFCVLSANNFGVPQRRQRVYIIGFDKDFYPHANVKEMLARLASKRSETRLGDVLQSPAEIDPKYTISDRLFAGHVRRKKEHKAKGNGFGYSLFNYESPYCNTITARYYKDGVEILIDQSDIGKNPRKLTPRECAGIQGFPDEFNISAVSDTQLYRQFGNSVSVPVIRAIAKEMLEVL